MFESLHRLIQALDTSELACSAHACRIAAEVEAERFDQIDGDLARRRLEHYNLPATVETIAAYQLGARLGRARYRFRQRDEVEEGTDDE